MSSKSRAIGAEKDGKPALVPQLRFPEFRDQALLQVELRDVTAESTLRNGKRLPASVVMGVSKANGIVPMDDRIVASDIGRYKVVRKDWFAYNPMRLNIGSIARWQGDTDILVSPDYIVFRCLNEQEPGLQPAFLDQFRQSAAWENFVTQGGGGSVRIRIYYDDIGILKLILPVLAEQQKIADCLNSLDKVIAAQARKVDALKKHKKGLMQRLFPREGETQPCLRFPEFRDTGHWKSTPLGRLLERNPDYGVSLSAVPFSEELPTYLRITDISDDGLYLKEKRVSVDFDAKSENYLKLGDIVLARTGASVGKTYRYREEDGALVFAGFLIRIRPDQETLLPDFLSGYLASDTYWDWVAINSARSGQPGINSAEFSSLLIPCPPQISEQQRIAECLSGHHDLIAAESRKLEVLKRNKEGLMQQLFPSRAEDNA